MPPTTNDLSEPKISRESSLKRSLSISKSFKGLFKSNGGNNNGHSGEVPVLANKEKQDGLKNMAANKEKELQSSRRGAASPNLSPIRHVSLSGLSKLSLSPHHTISLGDTNVVSDHSNEVEDSPELNLARKPSGSNLSSSPSVVELESIDQGQEEFPDDREDYPLASIDTQLSKDASETDASIRRSRSTQRKRLNSFSLRPRATSIPSQKSSPLLRDTRERANTSSINLLLSHENESKCIYHSDHFAIYEDGHHIHHLKVAPIIHDLEQSLAKPKSTFSLSGFFKTHRSNVEENENLATAMSLLPGNRFNFHKRLSQIIDEEFVDEPDDEDNVNSGSHADENKYSDHSNMSDAESESEQDMDYEALGKANNVPKIVNKQSVIGAEELKLINQLTEKIDRGFPTGNNAVEGSPTGTELSKKQHLCEKYGKSIGIIGQGAYGVVKLCYKEFDRDDPNSNDNTYFHDNKLFYAVKELKPRPDEPPKKFSTRLTSEFVIGLSLSGGNKSRRCSTKSHPNILNVIDLMQTQNAFYEVMEFCPSGDLYSLMTRTSKSGAVLHQLEADCFMKQLLHGIQYMHDHGVAHCDIKPENLLFLPTGILKICDFGTSSVFQTAWEKKAHFQAGAAGSEPYVAPEEFIPKQEYDPRLVDCWSCGIIYCVMVLGHYLWKVAIKGKDTVYDAFLEDMQKHGEYYVFEEMKHVSPDMSRYRTAALYHIFQVNPEKRITIDDLLRTSWMKRTKCCVTYSPRAV